VPAADWIAAIATPLGRGGIGIVRVSGKNLASLILRIAGAPLPPRRASLRQFLGDAGEPLDEGIAIYFPAPRSYTGEDVLELHGHGGPAVLQLVLERCLTLGARLAAPGEFTKRAYLNDRIDLAQAESVADLIDAATAQAARCAMRSLTGEFSQAVQALVRSLIELRLLAEATLDFPDEEVDVLTEPQALERLSEVKIRLERLLKGAEQGQILREGIAIALIGQPNVGKSSLLNRLAGEDVAIVTEIPGTTRDSIRQLIQIEGVPVHLIDTAGLREALEPVEKIGVARTWEVVSRADAAVIVMDATLGVSPEDIEIAGRLPAGVSQIRVHNKIDLTGDAPRMREAESGSEIWLSAKTGQGLDLLRAKLLASAGWRPAEEGIFLARARHLAALDQARIHLQAATARARQLELFAEELTLAQRALNDITGEFSADDLLAEIFSRFCIGK
jgi:tRNA modification GTPase